MGVWPNDEQPGVENAGFRVEFCDVTLEFLGISTASLLFPVSLYNR